MAPRNAVDAGRGQLLSFSNRATPALCGLFLAYVCSHYERTLIGVYTLRGYRLAWGQTSIRGSGWLHYGVPTLTQLRLVGWRRRYTR